MWDLLVLPNQDNGGNWNGNFDIKNISQEELIALDNMIITLPEVQYMELEYIHRQIEWLLTNYVVNR